MMDLFTKPKDLAIKTKKVKPILRYMPNASASQVARLVVKDARVIGLTRGQFSLIDLIYSVLQQTGAADVVCCTWSAGIKDANTVKWMMDTNLVSSFMLVTDHSYVTRKSQYILGISDLFGLENIRTAEIHAKFVLIKNEKFTICIRTSMNLNANRTCESFEIDENVEIYDFYANFINSTFKETPKGFIADSSTVNKALDRTFFNLTQQFSWQNNG
jgi:hypothetical protein